MRRLSEQSLSNSALYYLQRYAASRKGLTQVLERKVKRFIREKGGDLEATKLLIAKVVERMVQSGYVDDVKLAEQKTASLHDQGKSTRVIRLKLRMKGLEAETIAAATVTTVDRELEAALTLVRKKKLGRDPERKQKDYGVLMRAGFSWDVVKRAMAPTSLHDADVDVRQAPHQPVR